MQTSNANQESRPNDLDWYLLGEYSLSKFLADHEKGAGLTTTQLSQTTRDLGIPLEYLDNLVLRLTGFAKAALVHFKQLGLELPGHIRVFCHKKMLDNANSANTSRLSNGNQAKEHPQIIHPTGTNMNGGLGYFIIERSGEDAGSSGIIHPYIDLYLYKEGE